MGVWDVIAGAISTAASTATSGLALFNPEASRAAQEKIKKEMDKMLIKTFYAPAKIRERDAIKTSFDTEVESIATSTKSSISSIAGQLSSSMSGQFSNSVQSTINTENSKWGGGMVPDTGSVGSFRQMDAGTMKGTR